MTDTVEQRRTLSGEQLEKLAGWMGWESKAEWPRWWRDPATGIVRNLGGEGDDGEWDPMTDANADYMVLQRARDTAGYGAVRAYQAALGRFWDERGEIICAYRPGDYALAVLAVLEVQEGT